jgi:membrane associated rhomboid family serine protease
MALQNNELMDKLKFNPSHIFTSKEWYRMLSYGIVHADWMHLAINMYVLWSFGKIVLDDFYFLFGNLANLMFLALYMPALAVSVIPSLIKYRNDIFYNAVGASGAISALVYVTIILHPTGGMGLIFIPISLPAWVFGLLYLIYTIIMSRKENTRIGHSAHLWGAVYGLFYVLTFKPSLYLYFFQQIWA